MNKNFNIYYFSVIISNIGNAVTTFVFPLFILDLTNSVMHLSVVSALQLLPFLIFGLPFGAIVDNVNIKKLMQYCDVARFFVYILLAYIVSLNNINISIIAIYITSIISGICYVFHSISEATFVPYLVSKDKLTRANSLIYSVQYITNFIVPIISGKLYKLNNIKFFFAFDAITFLFSFIILFVIKREFEYVNRDKGLRAGFSKINREVKEGLICLKENKFLLKLLFIVATSNLIVCSYYNCLIDYMKYNLQYTAGTIGVIEGVYSLGALVGALTVDYFSKRITKVDIIILCIGIDAICRLLLPHNSSIVFIGSLMVVIELTSAMLNILVITIRQESISQEYLGRMNSVFKTVLLGINPIGLLLGGIVIDRVGSYNNMIFVSVLCFLVFVTAIILFRKNRVKRGIDY